LNPWEKGVWCLTIGLTAAVLAKLWTTGLIKNYKLLFCYLATDFLSSIIALFITYRSAAYGYYYFSAQTLKILIATFMLMEIYALALEGTPALAQFGRNSVGYITAAAGAIPVVGLALNSSGIAHPYFRAFLRFEQTINATMAIFLILILMFMAWFPVRLRRNVIAYISGFILWSLSRAISVYIISRWFTDKRISHGSDTVQLVVDLVCLSLWLFGMRREGEVRTAVVGHLWNKAEADRLIEQLDTVNASLARLRRK
jgi:hypothetical protein